MSRVGVRPMPCSSATRSRSQCDSTPEQAQRVHHDQERGADIRRDGAPKRGVASKGQGHEQRLDGERERDVLADDGEGATRVLDQPGQLREIVGHERDVSGLDRGIAARRAHGDAEARARHGRRIVDPVTDHGDATVLRDEFLDGPDLVLGQELGMDLVDANLAPDRLGGRPIVAGQHDQVLDTALPELADHARRLRTHRIRHRDQAADPPLIADHHDRVTALFERLCPLGHLAAVLAAFHEVAVRAEPVRLTAGPARHALSLEDLHPFRRRDLDPAHLGAIENRFGKRVGAPGLQRSGKLDQLLLAMTRRGERPRPPPVAPSSTCRSCRTPSLLGWQAARRRFPL